MNRIQIFIAVEVTCTLLEEAGLDSKVADDVSRNIVSTYAIDFDNAKAKDVADELKRRVRVFSTEMSPLTGTDLDRLAEDIHKAIRAA